MRRAALSFLLPGLLLSAPVSAGDEPDGSHSTGLVPPFAAQPAPPAWLRAASHAAAFVDTRHYLYEVYGTAEDGDARNARWIARYVMFPEGNEAFREIEQVFLFDGDAKHKPKELKPSELTVGPRDATWKHVKYRLVDRRDLMLP